MTSRETCGFGSYVVTEAVAGSVPVGRNSPQRAPFGLYAEQISGAAFTAPRSENRRSWVYRLRPSAAHPAFMPYRGAPLLRSAPFIESAPSPNRLRWDPLPIPEAATDFVDGLITYGGNGDAGRMCGVGIHAYVANRSMTQRVFFSADGELLLVPQHGRLNIFTELGLLALAPGEIGIVPRGIRFRAEVPDGTARGYVCENYGVPFRLPELGPIGSNGLANPRDFMIPGARYEDIESPTEIIQKYVGGLWASTVPWSPLDVVGWHGNLAPVKYDLARFNTMGTVSFDHPDPSINTVLTSPSEIAGTASVDFVIFPPRWMVAENTFRPPWYHRNVMSEFMGLIHGEYEAKARDFVPGGASLHNCMNSHGPDLPTYQRASTAALTPHKLDAGLAFMFETRWPICLTQFALQSPACQSDYDASWAGFDKAVLPR